MPKYVKYVEYISYSNIRCESFFWMLGIKFVLFSKLMEKLSFFRMSKFYFKNYVKFIIVSMMMRIIEKNVFPFKWRLSSLFIQHDVGCVRIASIFHFQSCFELPNAINRHFIVNVHTFEQFQFIILYFICCIVFDFVFSYYFIATTFEF